MVVLLLHDSSESFNFWVLEVRPVGSNKYEDWLVPEYREIFLLVDEIAEISSYSFDHWSGKTVVLS